MRDINHLHHKETIRLDRDQLEILLLQLGPSSADKIVNQSLEDLAIALAQIKKKYGAGLHEETKAEVRKLISIAQKLGMTALARICRDAVDLLGSNDAAACSAVLARLNRVGEGSLIAVWDLQDMSV